MSYRTCIYRRASCEQKPDEQILCQGVIPNGEDASSKLQWLGNHKPIPKHRSDHPPYCTYSFITVCRLPLTYNMERLVCEVWLCFLKR